MKQSGLPALNLLLGGLPDGLVEVSGAESCGKTTLGGNLLRQATQDDRPRVFVPIGPYDPERLRQLGAGPDTLILRPADWYSLARALQIFCAGVDDALIIIDGPSGLETADEEQNPLVCEPDWAQQRADITYALHMIAEAARAHACTVVLLDEIRSDIGWKGRHKTAMVRYMDDELAAHISLKVLRTKEQYGKLGYKRVQFKVVRALDTPPGGAVDCTLFPDTGFDPWYDLLTCLIRTGEAVPAGTYWRLRAGGQVGPGFSRAIAQLQARYGGRYRW